MFWVATKKSRLALLVPMFLLTIATIMLLASALPGIELDENLLKILLGIAGISVIIVVFAGAEKKKVSYRQRISGLFGPEPRQL